MYVKMLYVKDVEELFMKYFYLLSKFETNHFSLRSEKLEFMQTA